jgi:predicted dehydrogenase
MEYRYMPPVARLADEVHYEHLRFFESVVRGAAVEVTAEDGLRAVELGAAAERSARERRPVELGGAG